MVRQITDHIATSADSKIKIECTDKPGSGGANHDYIIYADAVEGRDGFGCELWFQNGPVQEKGVNGITHEALLAVVIDRLRSFQAGPFACRENELALTKIEEAMHWLHARTHARIRRGVEGQTVA